MNSKFKLLSWVLRITSAIILLQTLFFKFTGAPESIYIFETVGMEPFGRYASGIAELVASILFFVPGLTWLGAFIGLGVMSGAIISHLTVLGIEVQEDGGVLFVMAIIVFICCAILLFMYRKDIPIIGSRFNDVDS
ncbi:MAG: DoxX family protein [Balneolaceae bacterium]|nr:DoxX family protein [Balneolaceae bacterium]